MRRSTVLVCALAAIATLGCDKIKQTADGLMARLRHKPAQNAVHPAGPTAPPGTTQPQPAGQQPTAAQPGPAQQKPGPQKPAAPGPHPSAPPSGITPVADQPYTSQDTGTVAPGMAEKDVYAQWGPPMDVRKSGEFTYIYYPNGCERSCGTADVVFLDNGQVVDAITRWPGHHYSGQSSSPASLKAGETRRGGDTLQIKHP